ncbi:MAG: hypothetical protein MPF33_04030 [Candidatus Aramenus sp.]|jgi:hypothetical protein|nr:hypothetical protein [Candidatus Aramenus sp.]
MPIGELLTFDEGDFEGTIDYSSSLRAVKLGAENKEAGFNFFAENEPHKSYIVVGTETNNRLVKWRLWINNFSLTREFKPNYLVEYDGKVYAIHVFDVTHLVKQGKNEFVVTSISLEPLVVNFVSSVLMYNVPHFHTRFSAMAGTLILRPSESISFKNVERGYILLKNPNRSSLKVYGDSSLIAEVSNSKDAEEIETNENRVISVVHDSRPSQPKCPAFVYLYYTAKTESPSIDLQVDGKVSNQRLFLSIENGSEIQLDKVLVNVMVNGITVHFRSFGEVKSKSRIDYEVLLPKKGNVNVRVVGVKAGLRKMIDKEIEWNGP